LKVLVSKGYLEEVEEYEKFLKERLEISLFKLNAPEVAKSNCYYVKRHTISNDMNPLKNILQGSNRKSSRRNSSKGVTTPQSMSISIVIDDE
jgi:hypothetical protein